MRVLAIERVPECCSEGASNREGSLSAVVRVLAIERVPECCSEGASNREGA